MQPERFQELRMHLSRIKPTVVRFCDEHEFREASVTSIGWYPRIDGTITIKFRTSADDGAANVGNSKTLTLKLRFEKKQGI